MPEMTKNPMQDMSQLYARVFVTILDSSIAEDFTTRHIFEDLFKLVNHKTGVVDMTRQSISRRLNLPIETLNRAIDVLESPDPNSRDMEFDGRRIQRLDEHRDWGWKILNWAKYDEIRTRADNYVRVSKHRDKEAVESGKFKKPQMEEIKLLFSQQGLPMSEAETFFNYYESNGWRVGRNPMKSWTCAAANWKKKYDARNGSSHPQSAFALTKIIEAKTALANGLKNKHAAEGPLSTDWNDEKARQEYVRLRTEIKTVTTQLARMA